MIELALPGFEWADSNRAYWSIGYDEQGRFAEWQLKDGGVDATAPSVIAYEEGSASLSLDGLASKRYRWNPTGTLAEHTNPFDGSIAATWTYSYSPTNEAVYERSPMGKEVSRELDSRGNVLYEWDEEHHRRSYTYDEHDQLVREVDPRGATKHYSYDEAGNVVVEERVLDATGAMARVEYTCDSKGRITKKRQKLTETEWAETRFSDFAGSGEPQITTHVDVKLHADQHDPPDLVESRSFDDFGNLAWERNAAGEWVVKENTYTVSGRLASSAASTGTVTHHRYNMLGDAWETSTTSGGDVADWVIESRDARGNVTGRVRKGSDGTSAETARISLDARGLTTRTDDLAGGREESRYDAAGRQIMHWAMGSDVHSDHDSTRAMYDADGREIVVIAPGGDASHATTSTYAANGLVTRVDNPDGTWIRYSYDQAGNRVRETVPTEDGESVSSTEYDLAGRATVVSDSSGAVTQRTYDLAGRLIASGLGDGTDSRTTHNALGWVLAETDADGIETTTTYDLAGRATQVSTAGKATSCEYDQDGRLITEIDPQGRAKHRQYDAFGRTIREWHVVDGVTARDTRHRFDTFGRLSETSETIGALQSEIEYNAGSDKPSGQTLRYADTTSAVTFAASTGLETNRDVMTSAGPIAREVSSRDAQQRQLSWSFGSGMAASVAYDSVGKVTSQDGLGWGAGGADYAYDQDSGRKTLESLDLSLPGVLTDGLIHLQRFRSAGDSHGGWGDQRLRLRSRRQHHYGDTWWSRADRVRL